MAEQKPKGLFITIAEKRYPLNENNYADSAKVIMKKKEQLFPKLTTTKLRGIYGHIVNLSSRVGNQEELEKAAGDLQYLKVKMAYAAGRDSTIKSFLGNTNLMEMLDVITTCMLYEQFVLYCRYAESLVAYFKYYGGKD